MVRLHSRIRATFTAVIVLVCGSIPSPLSAQDSIPTAAAVLREGVRKLWIVRLSGTAGEAVGRVTEVDTALVRLVNHTVPLSSIELVERQTSSNKMVAPAAVVFGLVGATVAGVGSSLCDSASCWGHSRAPAIVAGGITGAGLGALLGALIGSDEKRWVRVWP